MSVRSWVAGHVKNFFWEMYSKIIEPALDWVREAINNIVIAMRIFRHNLKKKLAEWLQNDAFFLIFIAAAIAAVIYVPKLIVKMQGWVVTIWVSSMAIKLKEATVGILDANRLIDLVMVHKILVVLWDDYKDTFYSFADAVSQFSAELGEGSAYLHAYFASLRGIMHGTNSILGGDPLQVEIEWYARTSAFFEKLEDRFNRYARDPGRMLYDFIDEVLIPAAEESRDVSQAELDEIRNNRDRLVEIDEGQKELQTSIDTFIELQPNVIEEQIRARWDAINEAWQEIQGVFFDEIMRIVNGITDAVEWRHEQQLKINAAAEKNERDAQRRAAILMGLTEEEKILLGDAYDTLVALALEDDLNEMDLVGITESIDYDSITREYIDGLGIVRALGFEPIFLATPPDKEMNIPSPFIGDY